MKGILAPTIPAAATRIRIYKDPTIAPLICEHTPYLRCVIQYLTPRIYDAVFCLLRLQFSFTPPLI